jgi:Ala-tRNA(Pro) deacylase
MPLQQRLQNVLEANHLAFTQTTHSTAFTAREMASAEHLPAREVAKTVVILGDGSYHMIVVPANRLVDLQEVRLALGLNRVRLATEAELGELFPDCELGAMPPVGGIYGLPVYLDSSLAAEPEIVFNAGTHREAIHMRTADYKTLVGPAVVALSRV